MGEELVFLMPKREEKAGIGNCWRTCKANCRTTATHCRGAGASWCDFSPLFTFSEYNLTSFSQQKIHFSLLISYKKWLKPTRFHTTSGFVFPRGSLGVGEGEASATISGAEENPVLTQLFPSSEPKHPQGTQPAQGVRPDQQPGFCPLCAIATSSLQHPHPPLPVEGS